MILQIKVPSQCANGSNSVPIHENMCLNKCVSMPGSLTSSSQLSCSVIHLPAAYCCCDTFRWPPQIDIDRAQRQLWEGYELARALPMQMLGVLKSEPCPEEVLKRLGTLYMERFQWLCTADPGDVRY